MYDDADARDNGQETNNSHWLMSLFMIESYMVIMMLFFRYRIGRGFLNFGFFLKGAIVLGVFFFASGLYHDGYPPGTVMISSMEWLFILQLLYTPLFLWRWVAAIWRLRWSRRNDELVVYKYDIGRSILYQPLRLLLRPLGLIDDEHEPTSWLKLNENRWMQFWEPLGLFMLGTALFSLGLFGLGLLMIFGAFSLAYMTYHALNNNAAIIQSRKEAEIVAGQGQPRRTDKKQRAHRIN